LELEEKIGNDGGKEGRVCYNRTQILFKSRFLENTIDIQLLFNPLMFRLFFFGVRIARRFLPKSENARERLSVRPPTIPI
jgi:hypothetical protein